MMDNHKEQAPVSRNVFAHIDRACWKSMVGAASDIRQLGMGGFAFPTTSSIPETFTLKDLADHELESLAFALAYWHDQPYEGDIDDGPINDFVLGIFDDARTDFFAWKLANYYAGFSEELRLEPSYELAAFQADLYFKLADNPDFRPLAN